MSRRPISPCCGLGTACRWKCECCDNISKCQLASIEETRWNRVDPRTRPAVGSMDAESARPWQTRFREDTHREKEAGSWSRTPSPSKICNGCGRPRLHCDACAIPSAACTYRTLFRSNLSSLLLRAVIAHRIASHRVREVIANAELPVAHRGVAGRLALVCASSADGLELAVLHFRSAYGTG